MQKIENVEYKSISEKAKSCMRLTEAIWSLILFAIVLIVFLILASDNVVLFGVAIAVIVAVFIFLAVCVVIVPNVRYKRYKYYIDDDMVVVIEGLIFINKSIAPIERIHQITIHRGPIDRMFGMSNVVATTAGGEVKIAFLEEEKAEEISARLKARINNIVKAEKASEPEEA